MYINVYIYRSFVYIKLRVSWRSTEVLFLLRCCNSEAWIKHLGHSLATFGTVELWLFGSKCLSISNDSSHNLHLDWWFCSHVFYCPSFNCDDCQHDFVFCFFGKTNRQTTHRWDWGVVSGESLDSWAEQLQTWLGVRLCSKRLLGVPIGGRKWRHHFCVSRSFDSFGNHPLQIWVKKLKISHGMVMNLILHMWDAYPSGIASSTCSLRRSTEGWHRLQSGWFLWVPFLRLQDWAVAYQPKTKVQCAKVNSFMQMYIGDVSAT